MKITPSKQIKISPFVISIFPDFQKNFKFALILNILFRKLLDINHAVMINSSAIDLIKTFNKEEFSEFESFVKSEFFNTHKPVVQCFEFLKKYYPDFSKEEFNKENLYEKIYPGKKYNDTNVRVNLSAILKLAESYLAIKKFRQNEFESSLLLAQDSYKRSLPKFEERYLKNCESILSERTFLDENYFYDKFSLENTKTQQRKSEDQYQYIDSIQVANENLTHFYFSKLLRNYVLILNEQSAVEVEYDMSSIKIVMEFAKMYDFSNYPAIMIYMHLLNMFLNSDMDAYYSAKKLFLEKGGDMEPNEKFNTYIYLTNFVFKKYTESKDVSYIKENLEVQLHQVENKVFGSKYLSYTIYTNLISMANRLNDFELAENYIHKFKELLSPVNRESFYEYALARNYYLRKDFLKAMEIIVKTKPVDIFYELAIKGMLLTIYYELSYFENAFALVNTYKHTVKSPLLKTSDRAIFQTFIKLYTKLLKLRTSADTSKKDDVQYLIESESTFPHKGWMLEKLSSI